MNVESAEADVRAFIVKIPVGLKLALATRAVLERRSQRALIASAIEEYLAAHPPPIGADLTEVAS